ncbi:MAG TPA: NAD(+) kinase [Firmicutes bacterium]|nr:NAD(+) kinase [Bacillota bacterium]
MRKIALLPSAVKQRSAELAEKLADSLEAKGFQAIIGAETPPDSPRSSGKGYAEITQAIAEAELVIVLGGDGSMLAAARRLYPSEIPLLGVNLGKLGFMADAQIDEIDLIPEALAKGHYRIENRMMLEAKMERTGTGEQVSVDPALNEFAFLKKTLSRAVRLELKVQDEPVANYLCDGLIVATPTGSTAYSLSAGGPILNPTLQATVVTPICPHSLNQRSIVLSGEEELHLQIGPGYGRELIMTSDSRNPQQFGMGDSVIISHAPYCTKLLRLKRVHFYRSLWSRLGEADF